MTDPAMTQSPAEGAKVSDTPRTDSVVAALTTISSKLGTYGTTEALADYARDLERELAQSERARLDAVNALEGAKRDAERLDWLEKNVSAIRDIGWLRGPIRAAIDATRQSEGGQ